MRGQRVLRGWPWLAAVLAAGLMGWQAAGAGLTGNSPQAAFVSGYQLYKLGDLGDAMPALRIAARGLPGLDDYALFYLGETQLGLHDSDGAAVSFQQLLDRYPDSLFRPQATLEMARIEFTRDHFDGARRYALEVLALGEQIHLVAGARLILGQALIGLGQLPQGYAQLQQVRREYPRDAADPAARAAVEQLLALHPDLADARSLSYLSAEAELLVNEDQAADAQRDAQAALALNPEPSLRAAMLWVVVRALRGQLDREEGALQAYLREAPQGPQAARALYDLALIDWHRDDTAGARGYFNRVVTLFAHSELAPGAMLRVGRTFEDDSQLDAARAVYLRLAALYPDSDSAELARFRAVWMLYRQHQFAPAASEFAALAARLADNPREADMYAYWQGRSLEQAGRGAQSQAVFERLAASTGSNYYPELASRRVHALPVALAPVFFNAPSRPAMTDPERWRFHLDRANALRRLTLDQLAAGELRYLAGSYRDSHQTQLFLLGQFQDAGDYYDALVMASRLAKLDALPQAVAERMRYPRAYWPLFSAAARRTGIEPNLLLALARQESLFNPEARSGADARGLMQLLPSTARIAADRIGLLFRVTQLYEPAINIQLGSATLKQLLDTFDGDRFRAVAAYNAGEDAVRRWNERFTGADDEWVEEIDYNETRNYVKQVLGGIREYRMLYPANPGA